MSVYVLIPGAGGDPWEWHQLIPELAARGQEAIAIRLPASDDSAGWSEYADAVVDAIGDRDEVVLVASSLGGFTAPIVCTRRHVHLLVLLNAMIPVPGETFNEWGSNTGSAEARRKYHTSIGLSPVEGGDDAVVYYHDLPIQLRAEAEARTWQDQAMTPLAEPWPLDAWPQVPTRALAGRQDRMLPLDFQRRVARERLAIEVTEIDGGHMVALSNPGALADRLEAFRLEVRSSAGSRSWVNVASRITQMNVRRMDNVGIVVEDIDAAIEFFTELGLELEGRAPIEGDWADGVTGLRNMRVEIAMMRTPDGHGRLELSRFLAPPVVADHRNAPVNALGYLRVMFTVQDIDDTLARLSKRGAQLVGELVNYQDTYRLCYIRGPEGILIGLAEERG